MAEIISFKTGTQTLNEPGIAFETHVGSETYNNNSFAMQVYWVPHVNSMIQKNSEIPITGFTKEFGRTAYGDLNRANAGNPQNAFSGLAAEHGKWSNLIYQGREGTLLRIYMKAKRGGTWNAREITCSRIVRLRENAAYQRIVLPLTGVGLSFIHEAQFRGNFDILTLREAEEYGYRSPPYVLHTFDETLFESVGARLDVIRPENLTRPKTVEKKFIGDDGKVRTVVQTREANSFDDDVI